ncbi:hypothetical protein H4219_001501 [Mycoemilia scoparia]|uniref:Uncharacterized protein n=1 Tax=Mycoemilia scoparia TaxID=417184 RepID=A0A9W8A5P4_9FUNG|nr:hypothetical protein H4219_001501 [Mycoemilia scoparia]
MILQASILTSLRQGFYKPSMLARHRYVLSKALTTQGKPTEGTLRPAFELALRASCLQLVLARWGLETAAALGVQGEKVANDDDRKARAVDAITKAAFAGGLDDYLTEQEKYVLEKAYKTWEYDDFELGSHWESLGILQWLLGRQHKVPPYYSSFDRASIFQATGVMPADPSTIDTFVNSYLSPQSHHLLDDASLKREIDIAEAWNWRARAQVIMDLRDQIIEEAKEKSGSAKSSDIADEETIVDRMMREKRIPQSLRGMVKNISQVMKSATSRAIEKEIIKEAIDDDFGIVVELKPEEMPEGASPSDREVLIPYSKLEGKNHESLRKISEARLFAFAWSTSKIEEWDIGKMVEILSINPVSSIWAPDEE